LRLVAQYSSASQQTTPRPLPALQGFWPCLHGQWSGIGPGLQPPLPSGCDFSRLQGSQQPGVIWQPRELTGPGEQTVCLGQQWAKQNSVAGEQTL
jgi:hypothetical protein